MGRAIGIIVLTVATGLALACSVPTDAVYESADCQVVVHGYDGPCPLGALPAFFDDFQYDTGRTTGSVAGAPTGDIFGENAWMTEGGEEMARAWYRFNRDNHPLTGSITFEDGVMRLLVPRGTRAEDFTRSLALHTGATFEAGTYHYRVRLGPLWEGQQLRQAAWTMSHTMVFETEGRGENRQRSTFWSEMDFENQNHFQGQRVDGRFIPDYMAAMSVGNHYGRLERSGGHSSRLSRNGPTEPADGRGALARDGHARQPHTAAAPLLDSWAERWLNLRIDLDGRTEQTAYSMTPVRGDGMRAVAQRPLVVSDAFVPRQPMHFAISMHWVDVSGRLTNDFWMEIDWIYFTPVSGLSDEEVEAQVRHLRSGHHHRVNTTGRPTFHDLNTPLAATIEGPAEIDCGEESSWRLTPNRAAPLHAELRIREVDARGRASAWHELLDFDVIARPGRNAARIEIEGQLVDRWRPHGRTTDPDTGWDYPHPNNESATTHKVVEINCPG